MARNWASRSTARTDPSAHVKREASCVAELFQKTQETLCMNVTATPLTAALAGIFSAIAWPFLWPLFHDPASSSSVQLMVGTLVFIALPAHVFVVGFKRTPLAEGKSIDTELLKRIGAWLLAAAVTAGLMALYRTP